MDLQWKMFLLADILLTNGDELNLNLPKFSRPHYFSDQAFWHFYQYFYKKI